MIFPLNFTLVPSHRQDLTVDTRSNNQFNKNLFSPLTYLASRNAASLNQPQSSPYSNNSQNMSNQALGYYYAMAAAAAAANAGSTSAMSPHMAANYKGGAKQYQPNFRQAQRPSLQLDNLSSTCYAGSVLNNANDNMYTTIVNSANSNVGSEQASISHFLNQADLSSADYNQNFNQNPVMYHHYQGQMSQPQPSGAPTHAKYANPASLAAAKFVNHSVSLNSCAAVTSPSSSSGYKLNNSQNSSSQMNNIKETSSYDMSKQQQQQVDHESRVSSVSKPSLVNEMGVNQPQNFSPFSHHSTASGSESKEPPKNDQHGQSQYLYGNDASNSANVDKVQEMMAKSLNFNENNAGQPFSQPSSQYVAENTGDSSLTKPYFVRPPVQYASTFQPAGPSMMVKQSQFQPNMLPPSVQPQYVYCYNALPSHMIQQQSRIITSGPLTGSAPVQMPSPMHQTMPSNMPGQLSAPMSVVFASNQHMAYSMAMSPQQQQHLASYNSQMSQPNYSQSGQPLTVQLTSPSGAPMAYLSPNPNYHPMYQQQYPAPVYSNGGNTMWQTAPSSAMSPQVQQPQQMSSSYTENQNVLPTYPADTYRYQDQQATD